MEELILQGLESHKKLKKLTKLDERKLKKLDAMEAMIDRLIEIRNTKKKNNIEESSGGRGRAIVRGPVEATKTIGSGLEIDLS